MTQRKMHASGKVYLEEHMEEARYRIGIILTNNLKQCWRCYIRPELSRLIAMQNQM